jgi:excisionase family DNA binding protein
MRRARNVELAVQAELDVSQNKRKRNHMDHIPFAQRPTCTVAEACEATGLGRTKIYELIGNGRVITTTVGRRRLVNVQSLLSLVGISATPADGR